jgi:hypothetical protein
MNRRRRREACSSGPVPLKPKSGNNKKRRLCNMGSTIPSSSLKGTADANGNDDEHVNYDNDFKATLRSASAPSPTSKTKKTHCRAFRHGYA